ncbi:MAG TPA: type II toxin-antitoxin system MqsR family toxin [Rhizomicrobium sp.]|nr:type II toxin-antitoxin system MqsR family toxin [Rhizomicrobium sp.]
MAPLWCHRHFVEKRKPSFDLAHFVAVCGDPRLLAITRTALSTAAEIGCGRNEITAAIRAMKPAQFQKSMTSYADHRRWQDVYHVPYDGMVLYVKFTDSAVTEFTVLSFKER